MTGEMTDATIRDGCVVVMTFVVAEVGGEVLDRHWASAPYAYIQGRGHMPQGFEQHVAGLSAPAAFEFEVEQAYGPINSQMVQKVETSRLPEGLVPGATLHVALPGSESLEPIPFRVKQMGDEITTLDGNHPFAGKDLRFMGKIRAVRRATSEELRSGRVRVDLMQRGGA